MIVGANDGQNPVICNPVVGARNDVSGLVFNNDIGRVRYQPGFFRKQSLGEIQLDRRACIVRANLESELPALHFSTYEFHIDGRRRRRQRPRGAEEHKCKKQKNRLDSHLMCYAHRISFKANQLIETHAG